MSHGRDLEVQARDFDTWTIYAAFLNQKHKSPVATGKQPVKGRGHLLAEAHRGRRARARRLRRDIGKT
jgi:hypothetical protein